jgi:hypothetical protein
MKHVKVFLSGVREPVTLSGAAAESLEQMVWFSAPAVQGRQPSSEPPRKLFANRFFRIESEGVARIININQIAYAETTEA